MNIEVKIDDTYNEPKLIIYTNEMSKEVLDIMSSVSNYTSKTLNAYKDEKMYILEQSKVESIYSQNSKIYARCDDVVYIIKNRLYELENFIDKNMFIRISNSEIINLKKVENIDLKITGTIVFNFKSGNKAYVSRRYVKHIKDFLKIGGI